MGAFPVLSPGLCLNPCGDPSSLLTHSSLVQHLPLENDFAWSLCEIEILLFLASPLNLSDFSPRRGRSGSFAVSPEAYELVPVPHLLSSAFSSFSFCVRQILSLFLRPSLAWLIFFQEQDPACSAQLWAVPLGPETVT